MVTVQKAGEKMIKVMFICTGNICRSAMAHAIMEKEIKERNKENEIQVYSCGTFAEDGSYASVNAIEAMEYYDINLKGHRATNIINSNIKEMDIILCATKDHKRMVFNLYPELKERTFTMKEFAELTDDGKELDIKDPWGYSLQVFLECAREIKICIDKILEKIVDK